MTSGLDLSGYNAPSAGYGAPSPSYGAPAPSYSAPAPSYNALAPANTYSSNGVGISSSNLANSGAYLTAKDDDVINLEYITQINEELDQLRRIRDLLQHGGGRISLVNNDEIVIHPSPRIDVYDDWNGLPGL